MRARVHGRFILNDRQQFADDEAAALQLEFADGERLPVLEATPQDPGWHPEGNVWAHTLQVVDEAAGEVVLRVTGAPAIEGVLRVRGPAGSAELPFMQRISPKRQISTLVLAGLPFLVVLGLLAGLWFARSGSQQKR